MNNTSDFIFKIDNKIIPTETINQWELKRLTHEIKFLNRHNFNINIAPKNTLSEQRLLLAKSKMQHDPTFYRNLFKVQTVLGNFGSLISAKFSKGQRKFSITDIYVINHNISAENIYQSIKNIMLQNTPEHLLQNLSTNPDHFILQSPKNNVQEVLEITGGSPLPTNFYAIYGDETGLKSNFDNNFTYQLAASARLKNGKIIGGIRHQIVDTKNGIHFRALVEFPSLVPNSFIRNHELHLACEFRQWIKFAIQSQ